MPKKRVSKANAKTSRTAVITAEREKTAVELRKAGWTYSRIAAQLKVTESAAYQCVSRVLARWNDECTEDAKEVRRICLEELDDLKAACMENALNGDPKSVGALLKIEERRAKLLGLDSAIELDLKGELVFEIVDYAKAK